MAIQPEHVRHCLDKAREISEHYQMYALDGHGVHKSADDLRHICQEYLGKPISVANVPVAGDYPKAVYINFGNRFQILIKEGMPPEWDLFIRTKEIFHAVLDSEEDGCRTMKLYEHLESMHIPALAEDPKVGAVREWLAESAAMEFLLPYSDRIPILARNPRPSNADIASQYGIPVAYVEAYLSDRGMEYFGAFR